MLPLVREDLEHTISPVKWQLTLKADQCKVLPGGSDCSQVNYTASNTALANWGSVLTHDLKIPVQCSLSVRREEDAVGAGQKRKRKFLVSECLNSG